MHDLRFVHWGAGAVDAGKTAGRLEHGAASDPVVVGDIPSQRFGFQPRPRLLAQLTPACGGAPVAKVLTGMRGAGKTWLAATYARAKVAAGWRLVAWVNAGNPDSLLAGLAAVAEATGLSDCRSGMDTPAIGEAIRHRLEVDGERCLLVFDDAEDPEALRPVVPVGGAAQVLITAAGEVAGDLGASIPVHVFSAEEALALLGGRTGLTDKAGAAAVAAELGYLPLAVDLAAAMIATCQMRYSAYLKLLRARRVEDNATAGTEQPCPPGVAEAVLLSLDAVETFDQTGVCARVMPIIAVLQASGVRREILYTAGRAGALGRHRQQVAPAAVDEALERLTEWSLLTHSLDGHKVVAPRLVTQVIRKALGQQGGLTAACINAGSVLRSSANALARPLDSLAVRDFSQQVLALRSIATPAGPVNDLARVMFRLRFLVLCHLIELGNSARQAIAEGEALIEDLKRALGPDHPDTLDAVNSLATAYQAAGRAAEAISLFEQTLAAREEVLGAEHDDTLTSRDNLAAAYQAADRAAEAIPLLVATLASREQRLGRDHPDTVDSRRNLADVYRNTGQIAEAIPLAEQILTARERLLGADNLKTLAARNNLAVAYQKAGRAAEAIPLFEETLAACERLLGANDPRTQTVRHGLGSAHQDVGRP